MELIKTSEVFTFKDTTDIGWNISGNVTKNIEGFNAWLSISVDNNSIGDISYNTYQDGRENINYTIDPVNREAVTSYITSFIDYIKSNLN